jgi:hypothetical protein
VCIWRFVALPLIYIPKQPEMFLGLDNTAWTGLGAIAGWVYCLLTAGLLIFANHQIRSARQEAKINRTLLACEKYDIDPVLDGVTRRLADGIGDGSLAKNPKKYTVDVTSILNYFESLSTGVVKGFYDEQIVADQLKPIMLEYVDALILSGVTGWTDPENDFVHLMRLYGKWKT